jgi:hypothetical protein
MNSLKLEQIFLSKLNDVEKDDSESMYDESFTYQSIFLSSIVPDKTNPRFLPVLPIENQDAKLFISRKLTKNQIVKMYNAEGHILLGKSCIINCLKYGSVDWTKANKALESIIELGKNIEMSELIQVATIYPISSSKFQVLTGHRRYFSLIYANGYGSAAQFKVYKSKPLLMKVKQFQENASREDLPQYGKLTAFRDAVSEIELLNDAKLKLGSKKLTIKETATSLGISMGAYDNYNVLSRYISVSNAYKSGLSLPFIKTKKIVLEVESEYKEKHKKSVLNITDKNNISDDIASRLLGQGSSKSVSHTFKIKPISSSNTIKDLLTTNVMELDTGVDWKNIDWEDHSAVKETIAAVIDYLENDKALR